MKRFNFRAADEMNHHWSSQIRSIFLLCTLSLYFCWGMLGTIDALMIIGICPDAVFKTRYLLV